MLEIASCASIGWPPMVPLTEVVFEWPPRQAAHANSKTTTIFFCMACPPGNDRWQEHPGTFAGRSCSIVRLAVRACVPVRFDAPRSDPRMPEHPGRDHGHRVGLSL